MTTANTLNIGLLLCDDVDQSDQEKYGSYTDMFRRALDPSQSTIKLTPIRCFEGETLPTPEEYDGYVISGSRYSVFEDLPWLPPLFQLVRECWDKNIKMVGICFGHQLLAYALGGKTERAAVGWGFGIQTTKLIHPQPWMDKLHKLHHHLYNLVVIHQDQVVSPPKGFKTIGESDFCPNSMMVAKNKMLGIQGHPEFSKDFCKFRAKYRKDIIGPEVFHATLQSLKENETHASIVLNWICRFFTQPPLNPTINDT